MLAMTLSRLATAVGTGQWWLVAYLLAQLLMGGHAISRSARLAVALLRVVRADPSTANNPRPAPGSVEGRTTTPPPITTASASRRHDHFRMCRGVTRRLGSLTHPTVFAQLIERPPRSGAYACVRTPANDL